MTQVFPFQNAGMAGTGEQDQSSVWGLQSRFPAASAPEGCPSRSVAWLSRTVVGLTERAEPEKRDPLALCSGLDAAAVKAGS